MQYNVGDIIEYKTEEYEIIEINPEAKRPFKLKSFDTSKIKYIKNSSNFEIVSEAFVMQTSYKAPVRITEYIEPITDLLQKDDKVRDHNGDCWTIAKVHDIPASAADDDAVELVGYDVDVKEKCMSFKKEQLTKITEEEYLEFYKEDEELDFDDDLSETFHNEDKGCSGSCNNCTCNSNDVNESKEEDVVNRPNHYNQGSIECIEYILDQKMNYLEGNVIKYVTRYKYKNGLEDLKKARFYLNRLIEEF